MKAKRAIEKLGDLKRHCKSMISDSNPEYKGIWEGDCKALDTAISALKKHIPEEPIDVSEEVYATPGTRFECPSCGKYLGRIQFGGKKRYCLYCGQAMKIKE